MKKIKGFPLVLFIFVFGVSLMTGCSTGATESEEQPVIAESDTAAAALYGASAAFEDQEMTVEEMLIYAIQDEYLAHGEYAYILDTFGDQNPFTNIIQAEEQHIASLKIAFDANGYVAPEDISGDYLVLPSSVEDALETGVEAEILNIQMYDLFLSKDLPDDVKLVFTSLRDASENHLAAFQKKAGQ